MTLTLEEAVNRAIIREHIRCLEQCVAALNDASEDTDKIVQALIDHWNLNREKAIDALMTERHVYRPMRQLEDYLVVEEGLTRERAHELAWSYEHLCQRQSDRKLSKLSAKKLRAELKKRCPELKC